MNRLFLALACCLLFLAAPSRAARFTAQLNQDGDVIQISYVLKDMQGQSAAEPRFPDFRGLKRMSGPAVGTSMSIVNGTASQEKSWTFTFLPQGEQAVRVGPATIEVGGTVLSTEALVVPGRAQTVAGAGDRPARLSFELEPRNPVVGQAVRLRLRLDFKVNVRGFDPPQLASAPGFVAEPLERAQQPDVSTRTIDGQSWNTAILAEWLLFPIREGRLRLDPLSISVQVDEPAARRGRDPFDFFGSSVFNRLKTLNLSTGALNLEVSPLPAGAPAEFKGAVGSFSLTATLDRSALKAGEALTLTTTIEGTGYLLGIEAPALVHSPDLERYDTQTESSVKPGPRGQQGRRRFKTLLVPRLPGQQRIDPVVFAWFDPATGSYKRASAGPWTLEVDPGDGTSQLQTSALAAGGGKVLSYGQDIRHVLPAPRLLEKRRPPVHHRWPWLAGLGLTLLLMPGTALTAARRERLRREAPALRARLALRRARRTLTAEPGLAATQEEALRGYLADRLNRAATGLLLEDCLRELTFRQAPVELASRLETCWRQLEFARYSNGRAVAAKDLQDLLERLDEWFAREVRP